MTCGNWSKTPHVRRERGAQLVEGALEFAAERRA